MARFSYVREEVVFLFVSLYNLPMVWDYTKEEYRRQKETDPVWYLERLVLYGLGKKKLNPENVKTYLPQCHIPEDRRFFLELLLWNKES